MGRDDPGHPFLENDPHHGMEPGLHEHAFALLVLVDDPLDGVDDREVAEAVAASSRARNSWSFSRFRPLKASA